MEIGSGNGKFIVELAINNKDKYFLGVEYSFKAAKKTVEKAYKRNIKNLTIIFGEANSVIEKYFNNKYSFDNIYLNFPDPWPKKRHSHRRIFNKEFLNKIYSILKDNGIFYSATDDDNYALKIMNPIYKESEIFKNILEKEYTENDKEFYQNIFAKKEGSVASPTSGLHFTKELLDKIKNKGIKICYITLHVGFSTFNPLKEDNIKNHIMHKEKFLIEKETADIIKESKINKKRIVACGTTVARVLESEFDNGDFKRLKGETDIFIYPPYKFKCVDALITNFHTPHSTLLAMVSAFAGYDNIMKSYKNAIENNYRFFSYGDAMFMY